MSGKTKHSPTNLAIIQAALELAVQVLRNHEVWHIVVNYPERPEQTLGQILEAAAMLAKMEAAK